MTLRNTKPPPIVIENMDKTVQIVDTGKTAKEERVERQRREFLKLSQIFTKNRWPPPCENRQKITSKESYPFDRGYSQIEQWDKC